MTGCWIHCNQLKTVKMSSKFLFQSYADSNKGIKQNCEMIDQNLMTKLAKHYD